MEADRTDTVTAQSARHTRAHVALALITLVGLVIRVLDVALNTAGGRLRGDEAWYFLQARAFVDGKGIINPFLTTHYHHAVPSAVHPPGFILFLALFAALGLRTATEQRYVVAVLGALTLPIIGMLGRRVMGWRTGLLAAGIAAIYPQIWINNGLLMSETLFVFGLTLAFAAAYAYRDEGGGFRMLGTALGLTIATATRPESLLLFPLIVLPLVFRRCRHDWRRGIADIAIAALIPIVAFAPWVVYNSGRFAHPVYLSNGFGQTLRQANCPRTYSGPLIGSFDYACLDRNPAPAPPPGELPDETLTDAWYRQHALGYVHEHMKQVPLVVLAREARAFGVWPANQLNVLDHFVEQRGSIGLMEVSQASYWLLALLAVAGGWIWRRRGIPLYPLLAEVGVTALAAALTFGNTRYRAGVEVVIVVLAASAIDRVSRALGERRARHRVATLQVD